MPEIKHTFTGGKMNKDLDDRLVPNGQYRNALNIQVRTTDAASTNSEGDAGTVQNLKGNEQIGDFSAGDTHTVCVGSITDEKSDKAYFFFTKGEGTIEEYTNQLASGSTEYKFIDCIAEQDVISNNLVPVVVDVHTIFNTFESVMGSSPTLPPTSGIWNQLTVQATVASNLRVGMSITLSNNDNVLISNAIISSINPSTNVVTLTDYQNVDLSGNQENSIFKFSAEKVLHFNKSNIITGINIIDDFLFFTDGFHEPKKINIKRCKDGTSIFDVHTKLRLNDPINTNETSTLLDLEPVFTTDDLKKEHITVIRKAPVLPPTVEVSDRIQTSLIINIEDFVFESPFNETDNEAYDPVSVGTQLSIVDDEFATSNYLPGDTIIFTSQTNSALQIECTFISYVSNSNSTTDSTVSGDIVESVDVQSNSPSETINVEITEILGDYFPGPNDSSWEVRLEANRDKTLFELKFPRFGYRYRYDDGEYSSFSPFTYIHFEPGPFDYDVKKGYNKAMTSTSLELLIKDFIPNNTVRPLDVSSVDILLKTTNDANVYIIKTISRGRDPEWDLFTPSSDTDEIQKTGEIIITSQMVHNVIEENQVLRTFDNVPTKAKAQEITSNRLVYGNYSLGYNLKFTPSLLSSIISSSIDSPNFPQRSVKSLRNYKWGIVFGDKYGRETPVIASSYVGGNNTGYLATTSDIIVDKTFCKTKNNFKISQQWTNADSNFSGAPESWMEYAKYYVKETSNEYYNLVLDRWYYAEADENLWLSFASADRNKVDEETYLILKNQHGTSTPVTEKARYKIIAIENEAPEFIKLERQVIANEILSDSQVFGSSAANTTISTPDDLMGGTSVSLSSTTSFLETSTSNTAQFLNEFIGEKGGLKMKIIGTCNGVGLELHDFFDVNLVTVDGGSIIFNYQSPLGDAVNYLQAFQDSGDLISLADGGTNDQIIYTLVLAHDRVVNKPEFEGRFFALIEKDEAINTHVETITGQTIAFDTGDSIPLGYIESASENPGINAGEGNVDNSAYQFGSSTAASDVFDTTDSTYNPVFLGGPTPRDGVIGPSGSGVASADDTRSFFDDVYNTLTGQKFYIDGTVMARFKWDLTSTGNPFGGDDDLSNMLYSYKQTGIDQGSATSGTLGRITISQISTPGLGSTGTQVFQNTFILAQNDGPLDGTNPDSVYASGNFNPLEGALLAANSGAEIYFKFTNDPFNEVYKVVTVDPASGANLPIERGNGHSCLSNGAGDDTVGRTFTFSNPDTELFGGEYESKSAGNSSYNGTDFRRTVRFEFRRVNKTTGEILSEGIDPEIYDPRAAMRHDGSDADTLRIQLAKRIVNPGEIIVPDNDRAVFETEPKEDLDLELYYEASQAIPLILKEDNLLNYAPPNSSIQVERELNQGVVEIVRPTIIPADLPFDEFTPTGIHIESIINQGQTTSGPLVRLRAFNQDEEEVDLTHNIGVGDLIRFVHPNGTVTKSRITAFRNSDGTDVSLVPRNITLLNPNLGAVELTINNSNNPLGLLPNQATNGINSGMQIQGTFTESGETDENPIPNGVFIYNYFGNQNDMRLTDTSWMRNDGTVYNITLAESTGYYEIDRNVYKYPVELGWYNCFAFGNGVESDRIRDDFNAPQIDNGVKVSSTISNIKRQDRKSGLIYSGIYNSNSDVNNLNQFIIAEKITKDLNPVYGSIQALKTRDLDLITFAEDRVLKVLSNKDAVFNADGNAQLTATNRVLGQAIPFVGDYGISKNPESLASDQYRLYFTDSQRGAVLRLSRDGLTPISSVGMKSYFRSALRNVSSAVGSFDTVNGEYNLTLKSNSPATTISFNEASKGWVSFKSFTPTQGVSLSGVYITVFNNKVYKHYSETASRNNFYGEQYNSEISILFNDSPSSVKSFKTINYEGSQAKVDQFVNGEINNGDGNLTTFTDNEYYNLTSKDGWSVDRIVTDLDNGQAISFKNKENKWFSRIKGVNQVINTENFTVQGLGFSLTDVSEQMSDVVSDSINNDTGVITGTPINITIQNDPND
tara:strand:+ start:1962 stop:8003 length:6042 start_codon:yes stop_codon:yes gene_type:complete